MNFSGKVALITGASSGIGADAANHLAKLGASVALVGRSKERLTVVANRIRESGSPAPYRILGDVTTQAELIVEGAIRKFGKLDILINSAGVANRDNIFTIDMNKFRFMHEINLRSVITLTKVCVPYLEKTKGNIINVSSTAGLKGLRNMLTYCLSKAALDQFTKCCALDLASKGIRVNAINPSTIRTPMFQNDGLSPEQAYALLEVGKSMTLLGRIGEVSDTSAAIAFLASDETASFLTGLLLPVDGGFMVSS